MVLWRQFYHSFAASLIQSGLEDGPFLTPCLGGHCSQNLSFEPGSQHCLGDFGQVVSPFWPVICKMRIRLLIVQGSNQGWYQNQESHFPYSTRDY